MRVKWAHGWERAGQLQRRWLCVRLPGWARRSRPSCAQNRRIKGAGSPTQPQPTLHPGAPRLIARLCLFWAPACSAPGLRSTWSRPPFTDYWRWRQNRRPWKSLDYGARLCFWAAVWFLPFKFCFLVTKMGESGKMMVRMFLDKASGPW